ncbi:hypothetical protein Tco_1136967 [Tanacetum coccineum]
MRISLRFPNDPMVIRPQTNSSLMVGLCGRSEVSFQGNISEIDFKNHSPGKNVIGIIANETQEPESLFEDGRAENQSCDDSFEASTSDAGVELINDRYDNVSISAVHFKCLKFLEGFVGWSGVLLVVLGQVVVGDKKWRKKDSMFVINSSKGLSFIPMEVQPTISICKHNHSALKLIMEGIMNKIPILEDIIERIMKNVYQDGLENGFIRIGGRLMLITTPMSLRCGLGVIKDKHGAIGKIDENYRSSPDSWSWALNKFWCVKPCPRRQETLIDIADYFRKTWNDLESLSFVKCDSGMKTKDHLILRL